MSFENIFIFVADTLRYDYVPPRIAEEGSLVKTLAPSIHTPVSFASIITARSPENHNVRGFSDTLDSSYPTIFERFENGSFYDHKEDPIRTYVLRNTPKAKELEEMEPPFVYVERAMEAHEPYNEIHHGNELKDHKKGQNYIESLDSDKEVKEKYEEGSKGVGEHFWDHVEKLKEKGLYENTLIVFTSDHGEFLGERINLKKRYLHNHPMAKELVEVPTVFLNKEISQDKMRLIDLPETCLNILNKNGLYQDGKDITEDKVSDGLSLIEGYASYETEWRYNSKDGWVPKKGFKLKKDILAEDLKIFKEKLKTEQTRDSDETEIINELDI